MRTWRFCVFTRSLRVTSRASTQTNLSHMMVPPSHFGSRPFLFKQVVTQLSRPAWSLIWCVFSFVFRPIGHLFPGPTPDRCWSASRASANLPGWTYATLSSLPSVSQVGDHVPVAQCLPTLVPEPVLPPPPAPAPVPSPPAVGFAVDSP